MDVESENTLKNLDIYKSNFDQENEGKNKF